MKVWVLFDETLDTDCAIDDYATITAGVVDLGTE